MTDFKPPFTFSYQMTKTALIYDYELIKKALEESQTNRNRNLSNSVINYTFTEFSDPKIILHLSPAQKEEKSEMTPLNLNGEFSSKQGKQNLNFQTITQNYHSMQSPPTIYIQNSIPNENQEKSLKFNWNNFHGDANKNFENNNHYNINVMDNLSSGIQNNQEIHYKNIENEVNKRVQEAFEMEKQRQKKEIEEKFKGWEETTKKKEIDLKIKHEDALVQEMSKKIQLEDKKIQMLFKIRELNDENIVLKQVIETRCPNYDLYIEKDSEDEERPDQNILLDDEERKKLVKIAEDQELQDKKQRDKEFYELSQITQNAYSSIAEENNRYELEMNLNPDLWLK